MKKRWYSRYVLIAAISIIAGLPGALAYAADFTGKQIVDVSISDNKTLHDLSVVKLKPGDTFNAEIIQQDLKTIYDLGSFYDVQANFIEVPEGIKVVYVVTEKMMIKSIDFVGNKAVSSEALQNLSKGMIGNLSDNKIIDEKVQAIEQYYHDQGYILAKVSNITMDQEGILKVFINEGMVEGIIVKGNEKTKKHVITREIKLKEQDVFNAKDAKRSLQRLNNLGFFEDVNMKLNPGREPNAVIVQVDVKEQKPEPLRLAEAIVKVTA